MEREEILKTVHTIITGYLRLEPNELTEKTHVVDDAGADSLALVEIGFKLSEVFGIPMITPDDENMVIENLVTVIADQVHAS